MGDTHTKMWLAFLAVIMLWTASAAGAALDPRSVRADVLPNGLTVVVCEDPAGPIVSVEVVVKAGAADEAPAEAGLAHLLEHLCWGAGGGEDPRAEIEDAGGATNAGTLRDFTRFYAAVRPQDLGLAVRALAGMVTRDRFGAGDIARQRAVILEESAGRADFPRAALSDMAYQALFGPDHPYGHSIEGDKATLSTIDSAKLATFHRNWYVPNNMAVVIAGPVGFEAARREVEAALGRLAPGPAPSRQGPLAPRPGAGGEQVVRVSLADAHLMAAFVGPAISEPAAVCATDVLATILGHAQRGRLVRELQVRRGLVKAVGVEYLTQRDRGLVGVWAVCEPEQEASVREAIRGELRRLADEPVSPEELAAAKRLLSVNYAFANETASDRTSTLGFYEAISSYRMAIQYPARVAAVSAADVQEVARWYAGEPMWVVMRPGKQER